MGERGLSSREGEQNAAGLAVKGSRWTWLGCGLLGFEQRQGKPLQRHKGVKGGGFAGHGFNAHRQVSCGCKHVCDRIIQVIGSLKKREKDACTHSVHIVEPYGVWGRSRMGWVWVGMLCSGIAVVLSCSGIVVAAASMMGIVEVGVVIVGVGSL